METGTIAEKCILDDPKQDENTLSIFLKLSPKARKNLYTQQNMVYLTNIQKAEELRQKVIDAFQAILMSINYKTNVECLSIAPKL